MSEDYKDANGNPITLEKLIRLEPEWAASRIREGRKQRAEIERLKAEVTDVQLWFEEWRVAHSTVERDFEIERLKEALRVIANPGSNPYRPGGSVGIARAALEAKQS